MPRDLLDELGALAREQREPARGDARFEALAEGRLDGQEQARLRAEVSTSAEGRALFEASRPFDQASLSRFLAQAQKELCSLHASHDEAARPLRLVPDTKKASRQQGKAPWLVTAGALLAAAALVLVLLRPGVTPGLPAYSLRVGGEQEFRGAAADDNVPVLGPGSVLQLWLRPSVPSESPVAARLFVAASTSVAEGRVVQSHGVHPLGSRPEVSTEGAFRIEVPAEAVAVRIKGGEAWILVVVASPERLPDSVEALVKAQERDDVQLFARRVRVRGP